MKQLHKELAKGHIKGDTLIDISAGPIINQLFPICDFFKEITILEHTDSCIKELEMWMNNESDAFDWSHAATFVCELEGKSDQLQRKEEQLRRKVKQILKFDLSKENPTDPIELQKADCVLSVWGLSVLSMDHDGKSRDIKKISAMLKLGGHFLLVGGFNATFYMLGDHKYHTLTYNEEFLRKILGEAGFTLECIEMSESNISNDIIDVDIIYFASAIKDREI
ncbi:nicotinamide N-methyltransferase-like [Discoglossus pictus]